MELNNFSYGVGLHITEDEVDKFIHSKLNEEDQKLYKKVRFKVFHVDIDDYGNINVDIGGNTTK